MIGSPVVLIGGPCDGKEGITIPKTKLVLMFNIQSAAQKAAVEALNDMEIALYEETNPGRAEFLWKGKFERRYERDGALSAAGGRYGAHFRFPLMRAKAGRRFPQEKCRAGSDQRFGSRRPR